MRRGAGTLTEALPDEASQVRSTATANAHMDFSVSTQSRDHIACAPNLRQGLGAISPTAFSTAPTLLKSGSVATCFLSFQQGAEYRNQNVAADGTTVIDWHLNCPLTGLDPFYCYLQRNTQERSSAGLYQI